MSKACATKSSEMNMTCVVFTFYTSTSSSLSVLKKLHSCLSLLEYKRGKYGILCIEYGILCIEFPHNEPDKQIVSQFIPAKTNLKTEYCIYNKTIATECIKKQPIKAKRKQMNQVGPLVQVFKNEEDLANLLEVKARASGYHSVGRDSVNYLLLLTASYFSKLPSDGHSIYRKG